MISTGITRDTAAASLGISSSDTVSLDASCTSPVLKSGRVWTAYPRGTRYDYAILETTNNPDGSAGSGNSAYGKAFIANFNDIVCQ